ncbi:glutamyl-Q-tRNA synthetase [Klebsiella pneumoniae]|uniref:Glutamyl-Q-tRNA synthetase n=1 Tax=Klebsiella pneumoniae TaxID=573 RepID=A0A377UZ77_KLEPN|nr:glutamyl-Q-tRNA synthetase [Klebsiella pneumoniae]
MAVATARSYREALTWLGEQGLSYYCTCTRARIHAVAGSTTATAATSAGAENAALRLRQTRPVLQFSDRLRGTLIGQ